MDHAGRPRFWAAFSLARHGAHWAEATRVRHLAAIERFYGFVEEHTGSDCLDELFAGLHLQRIEVCMEAFGATLRNEQTRTGLPRSRAWLGVLRFVTGCLEELVHHLPAGNPPHVLRSLSRLSSLADRFAAGCERRRQKIRALPAAVIEDLYDIAWPESKRNPFRSAPNRYRNFVLLLLLLHQGLRRGEALLLPVNAVHSERDSLGGAQRYWMDVAWNPYERSDPRTDAPGLKNSWSMRQIPIAEPLALTVANYADNYRGRQRHSFLFASQERLPLSVVALTSVFRTLSACLSRAAARELWSRRRESWISPHDFRHTCAVVRLRQLVTSGVELESAIEMLRGFFGWSPESDMPRLYARAYFDERLATVWNADFDARVEALRRLK